MMSEEKRRAYMIWYTWCLLKMLSKMNVDVFGFQLENYVNRINRL